MGHTMLHDFTVSSHGRILHWATSPYNSPLNPQIHHHFPWNMSLLNGFFNGGILMASRRSPVTPVEASSSRGKTSRSPQILKRIRKLQNTTRSKLPALRQPGACQGPQGPSHPSQGPMKMNCRHIYVCNIWMYVFTVCLFNYIYI